jgi:predicted RNase H-like HicB family nuclease
MTQHYSVVVEQEPNGTFSAWVAGLPGVYAAANSAAVAKRAIRSALAAHLGTLADLGRSAVPKAEMLVIRADAAGTGRRPTVRYVGVGALMGRRRTKAKSDAARINGRLGGRPRKVDTSR